MFACTSNSVILPRVRYKTHIHYIAKINFGALKKKNRKKKDIYLYPASKNGQIIRASLFFSINVMTRLIILYIDPLNAVGVTKSVSRPFKFCWTTTRNVLKIHLFVIMILILNH